MDSFQFAVFIVLWERILRAFDSSSRELQSPKIDLSVACILLNCTKNELQYLREDWDSVLETATAIIHSWNVNATFSAQNHAVRTLSTCSTNFVDPGHTFNVNVFYRTIPVLKGISRVDHETFQFSYLHRLATSSYEHIKTFTASITKK